MTFVAPNFTWPGVVKTDTILGLSPTNDPRLGREAHLCRCCLHQYPGCQTKQSIGRRENSQCKIQVPLNTLIRESGRKC